MKRTSITLDDPLYDAGLQLAAKRGFRQSFSAYVSWLIGRDAEGGVSREVLPQANPTKAAVKSKPAKTVGKAKPAKRRK